MEYAFQPVPAKEAAAFIRRKLPLTKDQFSKLLPELQGLAFTVSGINAADALQDLRDTVATYPEGALFKTLKKDVAGKLSRYLESDQLELIESDPEEKLAQKKQLERRAGMLIRHHGNQAYAHASYLDLEASKEVFTHWKYLTVGDENVRDSHRALDGLVLPRDHEFWQTHFPPWEFGCRCQIVPVTASEYEEYQKLDATREQADRNTLDEAGNAMLTNERKLIRKIGGNPTNVDLRAPIERIGVENPYIFRPDELQIPLESIAERYDATVFKQFQKWAKAEKLDDGRTVWAWLSAGRQKVPKLQLGFPAAVDTLKQVRKLGGSTGALLMQDPGGQRFVMKSGSSAAHLREEFLADELYRSLGVAVPESRLYETAAGPVKLSKWLDGETLADALKDASPAESAALLKQAQESYLADVMLGNWDVAGLGLDNLMVDKAGKIWRIDNGGALRFRAQGRPKDFLPEALELDTLRNPKINSSSARVFGDLKDTDIVASVEDLEKKMPALIAAAPAELKAVLQSRFEYLQTRLLPKSTGPFNKAFAKEVQQAQLTGVTYQGDRDLVEDTSILFWQEKDATGQIVTKAKLKLTEAGSDAIVRKLGTSISGVSTGPAVRSLSSDVFWPDLLTGVKHINHHAADGIYNAAKLANLSGLQTKLKAFKAVTPDEKAMKKAYLSHIEEALAAKEAKKTTANFSQFEAAPPVAPPAAAAGSLKVSADNISFKAKDRQRGRAEETATQIWTQDGYRISNDQASMHFVPWKDANGHATTDRYAFRGMVEVTVPGEASPAVLNRASDLLREAGVDAAPATAAYQELVYLQKNLNLQGLTPARTNAWKAIVDDTTLDEAGKVTKLRAWIQKTLKLDVDANYNPLGRSDSRGQGWRMWERFDLPRTQVESEMSGYLLFHNVAGNLPDVLDSILHGGGWFTPTMERLRTGVSISAGMSPVADMGTGGANYLFTRILPEATAKARQGLTFKIGNLARTDHFSYGSDYFGDVRPLGQNNYNFDPHKKRASNVKDWKVNAARGSNETIFKNGLPLLDEVQTIRAGSAAKRADILKVFQRHGITTLPDGRDITSVVII
jgi:SPP1 gp7 family putative phage head morphogenesis protein